MPRKRAHHRIPTNTNNKNGNSKKTTRNNKKAAPGLTKMTLSTKSAVEGSTCSRSQRRQGRLSSSNGCGSGGKKLLTRDTISSKMRSAYRRSLDPCDNSNDSGLGFEHYNDSNHRHHHHNHNHHHHSVSSLSSSSSSSSSSVDNSRLSPWIGERAETKRLRMDIKMEDEEANDSYCFSTTNSIAARQCRDDTSLIRSPSLLSVPSSQNLSNNANSTVSPRIASRNNSLNNRQTSTSLITQTIQQLSATSRYKDVRLIITKQPEPQHRARYQTEGSRGAVKDRDGNGSPTVQLKGYSKLTTLQVYIGTDVGKPAPHMFYQACKVSGKNSTPCVEKKIDGTCVIELILDPTKNMSATCDCIGILKERNVDVEHRFPEQLGNRNKKKSTRCRMIFRTSITHDNGETEILQVCSQPIVCTQPPGIPEICKKSLTSCPANGGLELFVFGKNFLKDTKVYFQQVDDGKLCWEQYAIPDKEFLQQTHLVCFIPPYRIPNITEPVTVRLCVVSSGKTSESHQFVYTPINGSLSVPPQQSQCNQSNNNNNTHFLNEWNTRKEEQDLDMMPPPESSLVLNSRRSSITFQSPSSPLHSLKQEYIDENSQNSNEAYNPAVAAAVAAVTAAAMVETSTELNHDSGITVMNDNSMEILEQTALIDHLNENSNLSMNNDHHTSMESVRRNSDSMFTDENSCNGGMLGQIVVPQNQGAVKSPLEKVIDLRMKLPSVNNDVGNFVNASDFIDATSNVPFPNQSVQSVENFLTSISSVQTSNVSDKTNLLTCSLAAAAASNPLMSSTQTAVAPPTGVFLTQQPFLCDPITTSSIAKSEAAAVGEQTFSGTTNISSNNVTNTTVALESGGITTSINTDKLHEIFNAAATLDSHNNNNMDRSQKNQTMEQTSRELLLNEATSLLNHQHHHQSLSSDVMLNAAAAVSSNLICPNIMNVPSNITNTQPPNVEENTLLSNASATTGRQSTVAAATTNLLSSSESIQGAANILNTSSEDIVLLQAAADYINTQKKICNLDKAVAGIQLTAASAPVVAVQQTPVAVNNFNDVFPTMAPMPKITLNDPHHHHHHSQAIKEQNLIIQRNNDSHNNNVNDKKNDDRMIPQSFATLSENDLLNLINPSCFDQGNHHHYT